MIVFDASSVVGAALKADSVPERALLKARDTDIFALSPAADTEIAEVLGSRRFAVIISRERRQNVLGSLRVRA